MRVWLWRNGRGSENALPPGCEEIRCRISLRQASPIAGAVRADSQEGLALMWLAEALLRIPDRATAEALIRDKLDAAHWDKALASATRLMVGKCCRLGVGVDWQNVASG